MSDAAERVQALYEEVVDWVDRPGNRDFMCAEPQERLDEFARALPVPVGVVLTRMQFLGAWHSALNVASLVKSHSAPRGGLRLAHEYGVLETRLARHSFRSDQRPRKRPRLSMHGLALRVARAAALGCTGDCSFLGRTLLEELESGLLLQDQSALVPFVVRLFCRWQGLREPNLGAEAIERDEYRSILAAWETPADEELAPLLGSACDLHLVRAQEDSGDEMFEFSDQVYAVYPVEILMVLRLRRERGLPLPAVDHPLMTMPMGELVEVRGSGDPLLLRVAERVEMLGAA